MIPLFKVRMSPTIDEELSATLHSGFIAQGPRVDELEKAVQKELGLAREPVAVNSGTSALDLAMDLIGIGPGDEVISTPMTCYASNVNIIRRGAKIVWADVYNSNGLINPHSVEEKITDKTKAIVAVDWAGQFAYHDMLKEFGVPVIEDAAHVWDTFDHDQPRGDYIMYSLQAIKFLTTGDGGLLVTPDEETRRLARMKRWYGLDRDNNENFRATQDIKVLGTKYNMNDISAAIGLANLRYARNSVEKHMANADYLTRELSNLGWANILPRYEDSSYWIFPIIMKGTANRDLFEKYMNSVGIQTAQVHFRNDKYSITEQFAEDSLEGLDYFANGQTNLPVGWWLSDSELEYIVEMVKSFRVFYES